MNVNEYDIIVVNQNPKSTLQAGGILTYITNTYKINKHNLKILEFHKKSSKNQIANAQYAPDSKNATYEEINTSFVKTINKRLKKVVGKKIFLHLIINWWKIDQDILRNNKVYLIDHGVGWKAAISNAKYKKSFSRLISLDLYTFINLPKIRKRAINTTLITFSEEDNIVLKERNIHFRKILLCPTVKLGKNDAKFYRTKPKYDLSYFGRYSWQKNITLLNKVVNKTNSSLVTGGFGRWEKKINQIKNVNNNGYLYKDSEITNLIKKSKFYILVSRFEGCPFSISDAFNANTPVIIYNSFPDAKYLVGPNNERGFLVYKRKDITKAIEESKRILPADYKKMKENIVSFMRDTNYNIETFNELWENLYN